MQGRSAVRVTAGYCQCGRIAVSMVDSDGSISISRRRHIVRLAVFAGFLFALFYLLAVRHIIDIEEVRRAVSATGPAAPLAYVVVSAVLGAAFVPGPILAASSGVLFGPVLGIFVTLGAAVGTAIVASRLGPSSWSRQCAGSAGAETRRSHRHADQTARVVGGRWSAVHPRYIGCVRLVRVRCVRNSVVADGRRLIYRFSAAGFRLYRAWRLDRESLVAVSVFSDSGVERDGHRRRAGCATWISQVARACRRRRGPWHP